MSYTIALSQRLIKVDFSVGSGTCNSKQIGTKIIQLCVLFLFYCYFGSGIRSGIGFL